MCWVLAAGSWQLFGMWRSLVAHLTGGQGVAGSNPVIPTNKFKVLRAIHISDKFH